MTKATDKFEPEMLQVRWILNRLDAEELVLNAVRALEHGFDGTALRQLAGLDKPTNRDLGNLPERAFAEMGLKPCNRDHAESFLMAREAGLTVPTVYSLVEGFPDFAPRWRTHLAEWAGEPAGSYNDMAEFVHFVVEDLYEKDKTDEVQRAFHLLEVLFVEGGQQTKDLVGLGFFESLQNVASWKPYGYKVFEQFLGPTSKKVWLEIEQIWVGKSSLMDVIRAEQQRK